MNDKQSIEPNLSIARFTAHLTMHGERYQVDIGAITGHELSVRSRADLVPGAQIQILVCQRPRDEPTSLRVEVLDREARSEPGKSVGYMLRLLPQPLPRWLQQVFNVRASFRTPTRSGEELTVLLCWGEQSWRGQLVDASPEGISIRCTASLLTLSAIGSQVTVTLEFPGGATTFPVRLRRLQPTSGGSLVGIELLDDGRVETRTARMLLVEYIMQLQREELQRHRGS
jgi:hypothetical protein